MLTLPTVPGLGFFRRDSGNEKALKSHGKTPLTTSVPRFFASVLGG